MGFRLKNVQISVIIVTNDNIFASKERKIIMKKNMTWMGILVLLIFGLTIFTGCAEKKSVVTKDTPQEQAPAQTAPKTPESSKPNDTANLNTINQSDTAREQPIKTADKTALADILFMISILILTAPSSVLMPVKFSRSMPISF